MQVQAKLPYHREAMAPCVRMQMLQAREVSLDHFLSWPLTLEVYLAQESIEIGKIPGAGVVVCSTQVLEGNEVVEVFRECAEKNGFTHTYTSGQWSGK